ncbi:MAG: transcription termination/antitermination protein NusG [Deltaproteobacteria bacterium]|nr:transcription termination/antitermination protein NusG [Deltaproteobacteria bacterium]
MKWYAIHVYSGYELKAKQALEERIKQSPLRKYFGEVFVPSENVVEMVKGKKRTSARRFFPGYILVKMIFIDETWHLVKDSPRVTGFVGGQTKPPSISEDEVKRISLQMEEGIQKPKARAAFSEGDKVRVVDGPFANFNGVVEEINLDKGKVRVLVSIFGRATPIELDFIQVEKD